ncbi:MAG: nitrite reductase large subunit NirB [bacterium]|nr:nitrite reductase large subunit NirB [bacterium]
MKKNLVIVGNGMVGHHFVQQAIKEKLSEHYHIHVFSEEAVPAYDRVQLSSYFKHFDLAQLNLVDLEQYQQEKIMLHQNDLVTSIDRENKIINTQNTQLAYEILVLATGSYPFVPPIPGHQHENCFVYRTISDLDAITQSAKKSKVGVVVGGGLLGLEAANALMNLGLETHVVEFAPQLMGIQLDVDGGSLLRKKIESLGVHVHTSKNTKNISAGDQHTLKIEFADDSQLETDIIVFSAGIRPQDQLAKVSQLDLGERGGIVIDNACKTSDENIFAIGECALWDQRIFGLVAPGYTMASVAASQIAGNLEKTFDGADMSTKLKLLGVEVGSIGDAHARTDKSLAYTYMNPREQVYKKIVTSSDGKKLLGAVLVGDTSDYNNLLQFYLNDMPLPAEPECLILPSMDGAPSLGIHALPDTAQICSCYSVSKSDISQAVNNGAHTISDIKKCTNASTGCGGCAQLVKDVVNHELTQLGIAVNNNLCEHFSYTRQELYHLIRVNEFKNFTDVITQLGDGTVGCHICKPAIGSILSSCWNEYVLKDELAGLQETNDFFLGNIQKDGTYSVVPRIAGGEITPEKLMVLGETAKEFNLYTKITGGQRVDLFGARLEHLPHIWKKLIDAGFETGHAYAKSLRTVKSCVGSTWCRYGVDDSVGLAINLEHRYKGLRAPHKLKLGVSGCTRECAEAQSKDVGVIATENGWNLYVCGNGGMRPRHADLFATDLDEETLIKYIDRFFMFYTRTADKLQRTSVWMEKMEGGIEYLREVIIQDSLGIAQQLEDEMQIVIQNYQCEWKTTIENSDKLKRFNHFINSSKGDDNIVFVQERDQIRPANINEKQTIKYQEVN